MIEFLITGRGAGKTSAAADWVKQGIKYQGKGLSLTAIDIRWSRVIITTNRKEARKLIATYDLHSNQVFTADEWGSYMRHSIGGIQHTQVWVDNADIILKDFFGSVEVVSANGVAHYVREAS